MPMRWPGSDDPGCSGRHVHLRRRRSAGHDVGDPSVNGQTPAYAQSTVVPSDGPQIHPNAEVKRETPAREHVTAFGLQHRWLGCLDAEGQSNEDSMAANAPAPIIDTIALTTAI